MDDLRNKSIDELVLILFDEIDSHGMEAAAQESYDSV